MQLKIILIVIIVLIVIVAVTIIYGTKRWQSNIKELVAEMEAVQESIIPKTFEFSELEGLPSPVQRYFRKVLKEGQPLISAVRVQHSGTFNMGKTEDQWKPFKSNQHVTIQRPGFVWDARIRMAPLLDVQVIDAYVAGRGILTAKIFGLITVMDQPDTPELAQGELMRYFAEAAWYPTALLPSQGVVWKAIDDNHASATLTDGKNSVTLVFQFDEEGLISIVRSESRYREEEGKQVATPWEGRFWDYQLRDGMHIPVKGEVGWQLPEGPKPYWRGTIEKIEYEYAQ